MDLRTPLLVLIVVVCAAGLSLHSVVESLTGVGQPPSSTHAETLSDSQEEDQFVVSEPVKNSPAAALTFHYFRARLQIIPRLLCPLLPPPRFV